MTGSDREVTVFQTLWYLCQNVPHHDNNSIQLEGAFCQLFPHMGFALIFYLLAGPLPPFATIGYSLFMLFSYNMLEAGVSIQIYIPRRPKWQSG